MLPPFFLTRYRQTTKIWSFFLLNELRLGGKVTNGCTWWELMFPHLRLKLDVQGGCLVLYQWLMGEQPLRCAAPRVPSCTPCSCMSWLPTQQHRALSRPTPGWLLRHFPNLPGHMGPSRLAVPCSTACCLEMTCLNSLPLLPLWICQGRWASPFIVVFL